MKVAEKPTTAKMIGNILRNQGLTQKEKTKIIEKFHSGYSEEEVIHFALKELDVDLIFILEEV